jgi:hypothetical protein
MGPLRIFKRCFRASYRRATNQKLAIKIHRSCHDGVNAIFATCNGKEWKTLICRVADIVVDNAICNKSYTYDLATPSSLEEITVYIRSFLFICGECLGKSSLE